MGDNFWDKVRERAYFNYLNRINACLCGNSVQDWINAEREQKIEEKINNEAYLHYLNNGGDSFKNWITARNEIMYRLNFLAFYLHESDINKSPVENWIEAQKIYLEKF